MDDTTLTEPPLPDDEAFAEILKSCRSTAPEASEHLRALLGRAERQRLPWHQAFALAGLAWTLHVQDAEAALVHARAALLQMQALQSRTGEALAWNVIGLAHRGRGDVDESLAALERALELHRSLRNTVGQAQTLNNMSVTLNELGRCQVSQACLDEALSLLPPDERALRSSLMNNLSSMLSMAARQARDDGQPRSTWQPQAERAASLARELLTDTEANLAQLFQNPNYPRGCLAKALVVLDELDEALPLLQELEQVYATAGDQHALQFVQVELARAWLQAGQPAQARDTARQAIALALKRHFERHLQELWLLLSQACQALADWQGALAAFQAYHAIKLHATMQQAEGRARSLAVRLDTARAVRESRVDALTGLLNRRGFDEALAAVVGRASAAEPRSLMLIDMDHFKSVNDLDGHARGDQALALLAQLLKSAGRVHEPGARLGGDEFAWFGQLPVEQALGVAQRLQQRLREECLTRWPDRPPLTLSIGIAQAQCAGTAAELLQRADQLLYAAKAAGRDQVCCEPTSGIKH